MTSSRNPVGKAAGVVDLVVAGATAARAVLTPPDADPAAAGDDFLIAAAAGGDGAAWSALVDRYLGQITGHAWYMLGDPREAEDVAQEAFLRLFAKAPAWEPDGAQLKTWLYRVVVNLCIDRKRKVLPVPMEELPEHADGGADVQDRRIDIKRSVRAALDSLPARQRSALVLTYYEGFTNREAGRLLGISAEAVESLLARGRRALKDVLQPVHHELMGERK